MRLWELCAWFALITVPVSGAIAIAEGFGGPNWVCLFAGLICVASMLLSDYAMERAEEEAEG